MLILSLTLNQAGSSWELHADCQLNGDRVGPLLIPRPIASLKALKQRIAHGIARRTRLQQPMEKAGRILFDLLMGSSEVRELYRRALTAVQTARQSGNLSAALQMSLTLPDGPDQWPWELLFDPAERHFLTCLDHFIITRVPSRSLCDASDDDAFRKSRELWRPPLRLLVVLATPKLAWWPQEGLGWVEEEMPPIDTLALAKFLEQVHRDHGGELLRYTLLAGQDATQERLQHELQSRHDLLYFVGHSYSTETDAFILLEDGSSQRRGLALSGAVLAEWLLSSGIRAAILSSCESLSAAAKLAKLPHLEAVIGMQMEMPMITASVFDMHLIEALAAWLPVERCVLIARQRMTDFLREAISTQAAWQMTDQPAKIGARRVLKLPPQVTDRPDWAIPVLFNRYSGPRFGYCRIPTGEYKLGLSTTAFARVAREVGFPDGPPDLPPDAMPPERILPLPTFQIGRWPVTNHQYRYYLEHCAPNKGMPRGFRRNREQVRLDGLKPTAPVVGVTWEEANEFCRWVGGRLPTADEWEAAARGREGRMFPWGDDFRLHLSSAVNNPDGRPHSVFHRESGASPFGVEDMCGNVFEWTQSCVPGMPRRYVLGGSWRAERLLALPSLRISREENQRYPDLGFRCAF